MLCRLADLDATGAKGVAVPRREGRAGFDVVIVKDGADVRAYENSCPHLRMPLEILTDHFLDEAGENLVCRTHGARFAVRDGYCISGPCQGAWLKAIDIRIANGDILLAD